ncbi:hypothetical protein F5Y00DRAFT_274423 [Daldinia vernicosa]|uniref:uncharacterized protein n=1 Tax=Daldinia vernicosa TaxID=114800 RepID=UPI002008DB33|nr:uncharacterized protein F5Y00DRAFT_274423 [Daldinia vernicosa]KAI0844203.1 hypothetical protein F5Y00DRAFT_274423 [Daldinia vernicosa]
MWPLVKSISKSVGKAAVYSIIAIGVWEALLGCPTANMTKTLLADKVAWDSAQAEKQGIRQHVQMWFTSWWHCAIRSPAKFIAKRVKATAAKAKRSYVLGWMARNRDNNNNDDTTASITRGEERVSRFHEELDEAIHELTAESNSICLREFQEEDEEDLEGEVEDEEEDWTGAVVDGGQAEISF